GVAVPLEVARECVLDCLEPGFDGAVDLRPDHATNVLLPDRLPAPVIPRPAGGRPSLGVILATVKYADLDGQHAQVDESRPQAAREEADESTEQAHDHANAGDHQEPSVRDGLEIVDLVAEWQELLRDAEAVAELRLPVDDRAGEPADDRAQRRTGEQAEGEAGDRAGEHRAADRQAHEEVVQSPPHRSTYKPALLSVEVLRELGVVGVEDAHLLPLVPWVVRPMAIFEDEHRLFGIDAVGALERRLDGIGRQRAAVEHAVV